MIVVHLITSLGVGGAENQLCRLVRHSKKEGESIKFKHIVISLQEEGAYGALLRSEGIEVYTLGLKKTPGALIQAPLLFFKLVRLLRQLKPDILQTWLYHADLMGLWASKLARIPKIVWNVRCSNMELKYYSWFTKVTIKLCALLSRFPNAIVVNSKAGKAIHEALGYKTEHWQYIPNGFDDVLYTPNSEARINVRAALNINNSDTVIGMIARFDPMKDHLSFLKMAELLVKNSLVESSKEMSLNTSTSLKRLNITFLLVGLNVDNNNAGLMEEIRKRGLTQYVKLLGVRNDVPELLSSLNFLVSASSFGEGFPNVIAEAMLCGIPCVATDVGDTAHIISETGRTVPPNDFSQLADSLKELMKLDYNEWAALGNAARERIQAHYTIHTISKQYETFYRVL